MPFMCKLRGHRPSRKTYKLDPRTFETHCECGRCNAPLVRLAGQPWQPVSEISETARAA